MNETILILGGGVGGLVAANTLRRSLPKAHRVVLVDRESSFVFAPSLLWLLTGARTAAAISRPLVRLERKGIEVVRGEIERIDPERREAVVAGRTLTGDFLIVALGAELDPAAVPGLDQAGHNFYSLAGAERLRDAFAAFAGGRIAVLTAAPAYKCPAAPYETAMLLEAACRSRKIRDRTQIDVYAAEPAPMGVAGPDVSRGVVELLQEKGIGYHPARQVVRADSEAKRLMFADGVDADFDLLAFVPPHRAPRVVREAGLCAESGWIPVNRSTLETKVARVYAVGDVATIPLAIGKPLPKAGVFAHAEADVVAANIALAITGRGKSAAFDGHGECFLETGDGRAGIGRGNFYAEPAPQVKLQPPGRRWHAAKILFEKQWLRRWL
ncbi:MAG TPA: FAD/NAD(P)-binding oxidoreductase [Thermoanaerobaculia bacterium]|nr:FAD/NAD(P)-binding oxidoreductase [Thermoanaerobaculia bacterium]